MRFVSSVALYARAWVEILIAPHISVHTACRPLREGVGRNVYQQSCPILAYVALYARAWVEIFASIQYAVHSTSPSTRGRG